MKKMKKFVMVAMMLLLALAPMFADGLSDSAMTGDNRINVSPLYRIVLLCTGIIPGSFIAIKFFIDIIKAYARRDTEQGGLMKAVINLVLVVLIILMYSGAINFIFPAGESGSSTNDINSQSDFLKGLSGDTVDAEAGAWVIDPADAEALLEG